LLHSAAALAPRGLGAEVQHMVDQNGLRMLHWGCEMACAAPWYADSETSDSHPRRVYTTDARLYSGVQHH